MKGGFTETQNKAVWREMISLEDNATPLVTGEVDDISRKRLLNCILKILGKVYLKSIQKSKLRRR